MHRIIRHKYNSIRSKSTNHVVKIIPALAIAGIVSAATAFPVYGWWFDSKPQEAVVSPTHKSGLILTPLAQRIIPEFILEPLSTIEIEEPPSTEAANPTDESALQITPLQQADVHSSPAPTPSSTPIANRVEQTIADEMLMAVNAERQQVIDPSTGQPLAPLKLNNQLMKSAQAYADLMRKLDFFSHESPDGTKFSQRNEAAGYINWAWMGENIAYGQTSVVEVVEDWMNSEGHRKNILEPRARELGVGYSGGSSPYWVQEFGVQF